MALTRLFNDFVNSEKAGGIILVICTVVSLLITNSPLQSEYLAIWTFEAGSHSVTGWVNDGLMTLFFLLIGLELEREIYIGELSDLKNASLPIFAAMGGMVLPAGIHLMLNAGTETQSGFGIPMATDIAFALGILSLLGSRVPASLKVFLTALAVIDDLGAIMVIAIFYSSGVEWNNLLISLAIFGGMLILNRLKVHNLIPYLIATIAMWYFMLESGVHATISGVLAAFAIPFGNGDKKSPSYILQHFLHKPVAFFILPIFALANTTLVIQRDWFHLLFTTNSLGISLGLILGKPLGILSFSYIAVRSGVAKLSNSLGFKEILGTGFLGGIGFTMSIFITLLAFSDNPALIDQSKMSVMLASLLAGCVGFLLLKQMLNRNKNIIKE